MNYNDSLYHYGVKGMKWGVRRDIGKKSRRLARTEKKISKSKAYIQKYKRKEEARKKKTKKFSDHLDKKYADKIDEDGLVKYSHRDKNKLFTLFEKEDKAFAKWHGKKHSHATYVLEKTKNELVAQLSKKDIEQGKDFFRRYLL